MATASAINDALLTGLGAASVFGSGQVSNTYDVMESTSACCVVVDWSAYQNSSMTFGNNRTSAFTFLLEHKIKDTGNPKQLKLNSIAMIDKTIAYLKNDDTLQGTAKGIGLVEASKEPGVAEVVGGAAWIPFNVTVEVQLWDD